jgi:hypothetical protein
MNRCGFFLAFFLFFFKIQAADWPFQSSEVPQPEGLILNDDGLSFDAPGGKIIEVSGETDAYHLEQLKKFFKTSLEELGWKKTSSKEMHFERDHYRLEIQITKCEKKRLKISIKLTTE